MRMDADVKTERCRKEGENEMYMQVKAQAIRKQEHNESLSLRSTSNLRNKTVNGLAKGGVREQ
jgi:hypothetical protein